MASGLFSTPTEGGQPPQSLIEFPDNRLLIDLCGEFDRNLADIEQKMAVQIIRRGNELVVFGEEEARENTLSVLRGPAKQTAYFRAPPLPRKQPIHCRGE